jgi:hypothetical protein
MTKFTSDMMIWQYAYYHDELEDYLSQADYLLEQWNDPKIDVDEFIGNPNTFFSSEFDFQLALYLLHDGLLPRKVQMILAESVLLGRLDLRSKNVQCDMLKVSKEKNPGRPTGQLENTRFREVLELLKVGISRSESYERVAVKYFKSPDTIRRGFERMLKRNKKIRDKLSNIIPVIKNKT